MVELGAHPRQHRVQPEADAEQEQESSWPSHPHLPALERDRFPHGHRPIRRDGVPTGTQQGSEEAAEQPTRHVESSNGASVSRAAPGGSVATSPSPSPP
jgi:hypothetical protein